MRRIIILSLVALLGATLGYAQADQSAPPGSNALVARLSAISGTVSTQRGDTGEWDTGAINAPLVSGDKVAAGEGARAEVEIDYADVLRLGSNSQANLTNLANNQIQVQIAAGLADYVVLKNAQASAEIDTPNVAVRPREAGVYRIEVNSDSETEVIVRKGEADISTPQGSTLLHAGQLITIDGTDQPEYKIDNAPGRDSWDQWNQERDTSLEEAKSLQYTSPYYTGVQDLDSYGYWTYVPGYGEVWAPNGVAPDWTPYSYGRWDWEPYWGWTWVDYAPWGWAPFHYGRWFMYGPRWVWWPGPVSPYYRPVWAPAYVSFFGWGGGFGVGVGFGFGSIGWLPIGPCDPFRPWWGGVGFGRIGYQRITDYRYGGGRVLPPLVEPGRGRIAYSNLAGLNSNARIRAAVIRVPSNDFGRGVVSAREHVSLTEMRRSSGIAGGVPVVPSRASLGMGRAVNARALPHNAATHFFGSTAVRSNARPSFEQERAQVQNRLEGRAGATRFAAGTTGGSAATMRPGSGAARPGFQRFGGGNASAVARGEVRSGQSSFHGNAGAERVSPAAPRGGSFGSSRQAAPAARAGWQRFSGGGSAAADRGSAGRVESAPAARPGWSRFNGAASGIRESAPDNRGGGYFGGGRPAYNSGARPPLSVGHPIVDEPRSAPSYRGGPAYRSAPAPAYRGGGGGRMSAPASSPRGGGGGAHFGGGGFSRGGGSHGGGHGGHRG